MSMREGVITWKPEVNPGVVPLGLRGNLLVWKSQESTCLSSPVLLLHVDTTMSSLLRTQIGSLGLCFANWVISPAPKINNFNLFPQNILKIY